MRKLLFALMLSMQICLLGNLYAEEAYPKENYYMYYEGYKTYPIAFVQWGQGYVLDFYSISKLDDNPNILVADLHPIDMNTRKMSPKTIHVRVDYEPHQSFKAILQEERGLGEMPLDAKTFKPSRFLGLNEATSMYHTAGRMMWELIYNEPFFQNEGPVLKPIGESGAPLRINVSEELSYSRLSVDRADVIKNGVIQKILFTPNYFIIEEYHSTDGKPVTYLENLIGRMQTYDSDKDIALVKEYMGVPRQ